MIDNCQWCRYKSTNWLIPLGARFVEEFVEVVWVCFVGEEFGDERLRLVVEFWEEEVVGELVGPKLDPLRVLNPTVLPRNNLIYHPVHLVANLFGHSTFLAEPVCPLVRVSYLLILCLHHIAVDWQLVAVRSGH